MAREPACALVGMEQGLQGEEREGNTVVLDDSFLPYIGGVVSRLGLDMRNVPPVAMIVVLWLEYLSYQ